ncbi:MAG: biotin/lipoyl-binding protein [Deltaproteobacteria bacterium]|nr:biotin/lipoyl-binding protein [Deltaproteobacteria bacterium]
MSRVYTVLFEEKEHQVEVKSVGGLYEVTLDGVTRSFSPLLAKGSLYSFLIDGSEVMEADVIFRQDNCELNLRNVPYRLEVFDPRRRAVSQSEAAGGHGLITAPMPGKIVDVRVAVGEKVEKGQALVVIEAMKMQNELAAAIDGVVKEISAKVGEAVESGQKLLLVEKED